LIQKEVGNMTRKLLWWAMALTCVAGLTVGCAKKQVLTEGGLTPEAGATQTGDVPATPEAPIAGRDLPSTMPPTVPDVAREPSPAPPAEQAPRGTAAVEPAPQAPALGGGVARETTRGLARIHFDFDKSLLSSEAQETLKRNARHLAANQAVRIRIEGHCDERGTTEYNLGLGERRGKAAYQYLMDLGIDPNRMTVVSYGKEQPLDPRHNEEAWARNRRAEFVEVQR
jgi:peptidoglycan-associated lipoprotein